jgi:hypothetical protein
MKDSTPKVAPGRTVFSPISTLVIAVIAGISFAILAIWVARQGNMVPGSDLRIHRWVMAHRSSANIRFAQAVTWGGVTQIVLPILIIIGALATEGGHTFTRRLKSGFFITLIASVGAYLGLQINHLEGRVRPPHIDWAGTAGGPRVALWTGAVLYPVAVGFSRVWLGVHWPTDVIGGWLYALTWLAGSAAVVLTLRKRRLR